MSRIRSIHPGIWTDEAFVCISSFARLMLIGIWTECDDKGIFQWSPLKLKMRILPADNIDAAGLLEELCQLGFVKKYEIDGKSFGVVRNFAKFQRPKKPNDIYPSTAEILAFAGHNPEPVPNKEEPVPNQFPTNGEKAPQMEDGGWRMEEIVIEPKGSCETGVSPVRPSEIIEAWNITAADLGLPRIVKLTADRKRKLAARCKDSTLEEFQQALESIRRSKFLQGGNKDGWKANFDFFLQPKSFAKLIEGAYD
jgi:hypothetical protein